jgi:hypothetical protein
VHRSADAIAVSGDRVVATAAPYGINGHHVLGKACVFTKPAAGWAAVVKAGPQARAGLILRRTGRV